MSRIHEALRKADIERTAAQESNTAHVVGSVAASAVEEKPTVSSDIDLELIARHPWKPVIASFPTLADRGAGVEQFRSLRSRIYQARYEVPLKTILISSGMPAEGKTFVVANLAMSLARNNLNNILLIDGDLRRPSLHNLLGAPSAPGLAEYLSGNAELTSIMQRSLTNQTASNAVMRGVSNITFIPAGKCSDNSSEVVSNHRMEDLIATLSPYFDWILVDSPPVLAVTDAVELARAADAVLLVARGASTPFGVAQSAQAAFSNSRILGFVLNAVKDAPRNGSYSYYYYGGYETTRSNKK
jgi:capsular exopolysaccharide synthesis family protein